MLELISGMIIGLFVSLAGVWFTYYLNLLADKKSSQNRLREERYKNILLHMLVLMDSKNLLFVSHTVPGSNAQLTQNQHKDFLIAERKQAQIHAPNEVLSLLSEFLNNPDDSHFDAVTSAMRQDLGN